jgi:hypothetical protein
MTGHAAGVITIALAEVDDVERERRRTALGEPYRTLLGHFRHEVGHYYWDRLIAEDGPLDEFRALFGDERQDYGEALQRHYAQGPRPDRQESFVSSYAAAHPWEDWAECWAHYLHMVDAVETATACGLSLKPASAEAPALKPPRRSWGAGMTDFDPLIERWYPLTYLVNNLNRGLGLADGYPFVLSQPVVEKLRFIHQTIRGLGKRKKPRAKSTARAGHAERQSAA